VSRHRNLVGFSVDVAQLLRVLRAAGANVPESLELKLQQLGGRSQPPAPDLAQGQSKPFLTVSSKGQVLDIQQDLPISPPLRPSGAATSPQANSGSRICLYSGCSMPNRACACQRSTPSWRTSKQPKVTCAAVMST
jgi:hypothetical protein